MLAIPSQRTCWRILTVSLIAAHLLSLSSRVFADDMELSLMGGIVSARDLNLSSAPSSEYTVNANSGNSALLIFNVLQEENYGGGSNYYEFLIGTTHHELVIKEGGGTEKLEVDAKHYHVGGTYGFEPSKNVRPYFGLTAGLSEYESSNGNSDSFLSGTISGGVKIDLTKRLALRVDARMLATLVEKNTAIFCQNTTCEFVIEGDTWWQYQMNAGFLFKL